MKCLLLFPSSFPAEYKGQSILSQFVDSLKHQGLPRIFPNIYFHTTCQLYGVNTYSTPSAVHNSGTISQWRDSNDFQERKSIKSVSPKIMGAIAEKLQEDNIVEQHLWVLGIRKTRLPVFAITVHPCSYSVLCNCSDIPAKKNGQLAG